MARYRADDSGERRTAFLGLQLTPAERAEIDRRAKAAGRCPSDFARIVLLSPLKAPAPPARDPDAINGLAYQLSKVGTLLNQLAKVANETRLLPQEADYGELAAQIKAILARVVAL